MGDTCLVAGCPQDDRCDTHVLLGLLAEGHLHRRRFRAMLGQIATIGIGKVESELPKRNLSQGICSKGREGKKARLSF